MRSHRLAHLTAPREITSQLQRLLERTRRGEISTWSVIGENPLDRARCPDGRSGVISKTMASVKPWRPPVVATGAMLLPIALLGMRRDKILNRVAAARKDGKDDEYGFGYARGWVDSDDGGRGDLSRSLSSTGR